MHVGQATGTQIYQTPIIDPPLGDGDIVVTRAPYTTPPLPVGHIHVQVGLEGRTLTAHGAPEHPPLPSTLITLLCESQLQELSCAAGVTLTEIEEKIGGVSCFLTRLRQSLEKLIALGLEHTVLGSIPGTLVVLRDLIETFANGGFSGQHIPQLNQCLAEVSDLVHEFIIMLGWHVLECRRQELQAAEQPGVARGRGRGLASRSVSGSSRGRGHGGQRR